MEQYDEARFNAGVDEALKGIRTILDNTKNPQYPADVPHRYDDKYLLAEFLTRTAVASVFQSFQGIGLGLDKVKQLAEWSKTRSITFRFQSLETCTFLREVTRQVESVQQHVTEKKRWGGTETTTEKIVTTVKEYFWAFEFKYDLIAFQGNEPEKGLVLNSRSGRIELKTNAKTTPRPEKVLRAPLDTNVTWLFWQLDAEQRASFSINRSAKTCHTPRRNEEVDAALWVLNDLSNWSQRIFQYILGELFPVQQDHGRDLTALHSHDVFVPVVPVFEAVGEADSSVGGRTAIYAGAFLAEERKSLDARMAQLAQLFPKDSTIVTVAEAVLVMTLQHVAVMCQRYSDGVGHIEAMLRDQLISAIGKQVTPADFSAYMAFHHRKLFKPQYRPQPFSYAVRRPEHYPEGVVSLEAEQGGPMSEPVSTSVVRSEATRPMKFALDAATKVSFMGERYLHTWVSHQFSGRNNLSLSLISRARQFSSFVLLVGRISSADTFEPKLGIIIQNKDLLKIPLLLEQIPTPKEFRDAIESLSPEQQRFAKAFRGMQLESTLFGVCIIQIKPQLEALLKLAPDSLTKEIKLTQDLLSLFIEYQIPSDLLSYDGAADSPPEVKLARVSEHVAKMLHMLDLSKQREIEEAREREALRLAEADRTRARLAEEPVPAPPMAFRGGPPMPAPGNMPRMPSAPASAAMPMRSAAPPPPPPAPPPRPMAQPAPQPVVAAAAPQPPKPAPRHDGGTEASAAPAGPGDAIDYTRIPGELDKSFEALDEDSALRPTIINIGDVWSRSSQKGLLSAPTTASVGSTEQRTEKNKAFDLLDALSRSGALPIEHASLHVVIAATHCFDKTLLDTVIEENVNPIEKVERSVMIVATTIHQLPASELLMDDQRDRFFTASPRLAIRPPESGDKGDKSG